MYVISTIHRTGDTWVFCSKHIEVWFKNRWGIISVWSQQVMMGMSLWENTHTQKWDVNSVNSVSVLHLVRDIVHFQLRKLCHTHPECKLHWCLDQPKVLESPSQWMNDLCDDLGMSMNNVFKNNFNLILSNIHVFIMHFFFFWIKYFHEHQIWPFYA